MTVLYILENGTNISVEGGVLKVESKNGLIRKIPKETLESITIIGNTTITNPCISQLLTRGINVNYLSKTGNYFGKLSSTSHRNIIREKKQIFLTEDEEFKLGISKKFLEGKTNNQVVLLRNYKKLNENIIEEDIKQINRLRASMLNAKSIEELLGFEGNISKIYFKSIKSFINKDFKFNGRSRRPPLDPFNSMLSYGYTILMYTIYEAIESRGLNPYAGFFHKDRERHPTLASDLMEEFRTVIVDSTVLSLIQGNEIKVENFEKNEDNYGIIIKDDGIKKLTGKINKKIETENKYFNNMVTTYRKGMWIQVGKLLNAIEEKDFNLYEPLKTR